jgi:hypothetical protein
MALDKVDESIRIQCVIDMYGPSDLTPVVGRNPERNDVWKAASALLGPCANDTELMKKARWATPITYVRRDSPPFLIQHGDADIIVPLEQGRKMADALQKAGAEATLMVMPGAGHAGAPLFTEENHRTLVAFLDRHLKQMGAAPGREIDKKAIKVTASAWESKAHGGFADLPPELTLDGNLAAASSWRADGNGQWIQYDLGAVRRLDKVKIAFVSGNGRIYTLDILVSKTGAEKEWTAAVEMSRNSGKTADYEPFKLNGAEARYVRIVGHGNNSEKFPNWINITEVAIVEAVAATTQPATSTRPAAVAAAQVGVPLRRAANP